MSWEPRYSGPNRSGICKCAHSWEEHHLCCVMNEDYYEATKESYVPQECEAYGCNETGGLDIYGKDHCHQYEDSMVNYVEQKETNLLGVPQRKGKV